MLYLDHVLHGDLGQSSLTHEAVTHDLGQFIPATAELALYSVMFAAFVGIAFGVIAALRRNRPTDHALRVTSLAGISMPTFWIALVALYVGFYKLNWFPGAGRLDPGVDPPHNVTGLYTIDALLQGDFGLFGQAFHHIILPALVLAAFNVSLLTRFTRSAVLEVMGNDYVRAGRAKGLPGRIVVVRVHPARRAPIRDHRARARLRERPHRRRARREDLLLAGNRPVRVRGSRQPRRAGNRRREHLRRRRLRERELRRRHPVWGHRSEDPAHMTELSLEVAAPRRRFTISAAWRQPLAITGAVIAVAWILIAIFAPLIAPYDALAQNAVPAQSPSWSHLFGTDELGRDVFSRVIMGSRVSLPIALVLVLIAAAIGSTVGAVAGYFRGPVDGILMRLTDLVFAFPPIILAMVVAAVLGRGLLNAALAIVVVAWPSYARVSRGLVLSVGESEYVQSARLLGASSRKTLFRDILPNVAGPIFVLATLDLANAILLLSGLSFLGLGAQPPKAEWGAMVAEGTQYFQWWWIGTFPGLAIFTVVLAFNFLGDSLRDVFDPRTARRAEEGP